MKLESRVTLARPYRLGFREAFVPLHPAVDTFACEISYGKKRQGQQKPPNKDFRKILGRMTCRSALF